MLIIKIKNNLINSGIKLLFNCDIHEHNTRGNQHYYVLPSAKSVGQKKISHTAVIWFIELLENLTDIKTLCDFIGQVKLYLFDRDYNCPV